MRIQSKADADASCLGQVEHNRLDLQHRIWYAALDDSLYLAPLSKNIKTCLDIGYGTGIWTLAFAKEFPHAEIVATDLHESKIVPKPSNCVFVVHNAESDGWNFHAKFDYIHARLLIMGIRSWPKLFKECFAQVKPGGWVEFQEFVMPIGCDDGSAGPESATAEWSKHLMQAMENAGIDISVPAGKFGPWLEEAGFVGIEHRFVKWPIGPWMDGARQKEIGKLEWKNFMESLDAVSLKPLSAMGWEKERIDALLNGVRTEAMDPDIHTYLQTYALPLFASRTVS